MSTLVTFALSGAGQELARCVCIAVNSPPKSNNPRENKEEGMYRDVKRKQGESNKRGETRTIAERIKSIKLEG